MKLIRELFQSKTNNLTSYFGKLQYLFREQIERENFFCREKQRRAKMKCGSVFREKEVESFHGFSPFYHRLFFRTVKRADAKKTVVTKWAVITAFYLCQSNCWL